jgi:zinc transport system permease protein
MARVNGVRTGLVNFLLLVMVSVVITVSARMVGTMMINALMIIPGATARMLSRRFHGVLAASLIIGVVGVTTSLIFAILMAMVPALGAVPTGPILVLTQFIIFLIIWITRRLFKSKPKTEYFPIAKPQFILQPPPPTSAKPLNLQ